MTSRQTIELDTILLISASLMVGFLFSLYFGHKPNTRSFHLPVMQDFQKPTATPTPTIIPIPTVITQSQTSPDGAKNLTMTIHSNQDGSKIYAFTVSGNTNNQQLIYTTTLPATENMSIPFNTWSPQNNYFFLQQNTKDSSTALVFKANGQPFPNGENYYNVSTVFGAKNTGNTYQETTGWASETLLIINTTRPDGSKGLSYWFEIPSKAIIQLATEF